MEGLGTGICITSFQRQHNTFLRTGMQIWSLIQKLLWWIKSKQSTSETGRISLFSAVKLKCCWGQWFSLIWAKDLTSNAVPSMSAARLLSSHHPRNSITFSPSSYTQSLGTSHLHRNTGEYKLFLPAKDAGEWHNHYFTLNSLVVNAKVHYPEVLLSLCCTASCWKGRMH